MKKILAVLAFLFVFFTKQSSAEVFTANVQSTVTSTTTSTKFLDANNYRKFLLLINRGTSSVYVKMGSAHSATEGIIIPAGGNWEPTLIPVQSVYIKAAAGTNDVNIIEGY